MIRKMVSYHPNTDCISFAFSGNEFNYPLEAEGYSLILSKTISSYGAWEKLEAWQDKGRFITYFVSRNT